MNWSSWSAFLHMGGYGVYVWGTVAVTAVSLLIEVLVVRADRRAGFEEFDQPEAEQ